MFRGNLDTHRPSLRGCACRSPVRTGSQAKLEGLTRFWHNMLPGSTRMRRRSRPHALHSQLATDASGELGPWNSPGATIRTVAGVCRRLVTNASHKPHVAGLLSDIVRLKSRRDVSDVTVVVVENGPLPTDGSRPLHNLFRRFQAEGLSPQYSSRSSVSEKIQAGNPDRYARSTRQRLPIAVSRTVLNTYVGKVTARHAGPRPGF